MALEIPAKHKKDLIGCDNRRRAFEQGRHHFFAERPDIVKIRGGGVKVERKWGRRRWEGA